MVRITAAATLASNTVFAAGPPLWGRLHPGPPVVGYRRIDTCDPLRPPLPGLRNPERYGRQIEVNLWYPAAAS